MWLIRLAVILLIPAFAYAEVQVNDGGSWKQAREIHVNDAGMWKAAQEAYVNNNGIWLLVFTLTSSVGLKSITFEWQVDSITDITAYTIYLNDVQLCQTTDNSLTILNCGGVTLSQPAYIYATYTHSVEGESLPSNTIWIDGYPDWLASTSYVAGDKVQAGSDWAYSAPMVATTGGTSGATEPTWPVRKRISANQQTVDATAVVDNGDGTVEVPLTAHGLTDSDIIYISGTANYDGLYALGSQANTDSITITATYVAETLIGSETVEQRAADIVDNGDGTVDIPCLSHGFSSGDDVAVIGTTNYDGTYPLGTQTDPDAITITATYVAETASGYAVNKIVQDNTVTWELAFE